MSLFNELKRRNVIRVAAAYLIIGWLLAQVSTTLEAALNLPPWFDTLIVTVMLIGFPIALIIAWVYELTPDGIKKEKDIKGDDSIVLHTGKKLDYITIVAAIAVAGMFAWQQMSPTNMDSRDMIESGNDKKATENTSIITKNSVIPAQAGSSPKELKIQPNSIAVLPFADLSKAGDQEYFSDGMAEEILNVLVRVDALQVASRTSAFQFKGSNIGIPAIAKELKVRYVLEGSVRKAGDNLRITAQLIDSENDKHLWSETFDRPLTAENIFAIQDEISNAIVNALKQKLQLTSIETVQVKQSTEILTAYELFLRARSLFITRKHLDKADDLLIQAIELDSKYADAWAMRAAISGLNQFYGFRESTLENDDRLSIELTNHALKLMPNNALALSVRAFTQVNANFRLRGQFDYFQIVSDLEKALAIEPKNTSTLLWLHFVYFSLGQIDESYDLLNQCIEYEPTYVPCLANFIFKVESLGQYKLAVELYQKNLALGLLNIGHSPLISFAKTNNKLAFLLVINSHGYFKGWNRNEEFYYAYQNLELDHSLLIKDAIDWIQKQNTKPENWRDILMPLGYRPNREDYGFYDAFSNQSYNMNSGATKKYIKDVGIFDYWQKHGYPSLCKPIGDDDFECD